MSDPAAPGLRIAELAQRAEVTPRTIRYYIAEGLLPPPSGTGPHRLYAADHLLRLQAIKRLKEQYLPLAEIRRRLAGASHDDRDALSPDEEGAPDSSAEDYLAALPRPAAPPSPRLGASPASASPRFVASLGDPAASEMIGGPSRGTPGIPPPRFGIGSAVPRRDEGRSSPEDPGEDVWRRVTLAPGVELNYQLTGDHARDAAVLRLIQNARQILQTVSKSAHREPGTD